MIVFTVGASAQAHAIVATLTALAISTISPPRQVTNIGPNLTLSATVADADSNQWKGNGRPMAGANPSSYTITGANSAHDTVWCQLVSANGVGATRSSRTGGSLAGPSADTRGATTGSLSDGAVDLFKLTRVIEFDNTRAGTVPTGRYHVLDGTEEGFAAGP